MEDLGSILKPVRARLEEQIRAKEKWLRSGVSIVPNIFLVDKAVSPQAKALFALLVAHSFQRGFCFPSYPLLAAELGLSRPQIAKYLNELKAYGVLKVVRTGRSNRFEIVFAGIDQHVERIATHLRSVRGELRARRGRKISDVK